MVGKLYYSEEEYIKAIRSNDDSGLSILYKLHFPLILNFILNNNGSEEEARDVYQDAIIILVDNLKRKSFKLECKIKTYIYSVCRRLWLTELRHKGNFIGGLREVESFIEIKEDEVENFEENERKFRIMDESLIELGEPCRTILKDFYLNRISMLEIKDKMGYTNTDNAKNQKYKCLQRLKKIFFSIYKN